MERLKAILKESGCDAWEIRDTKTEGWEFYFIRHALDQNRFRDVRHIDLTVYKKSEDGSYIGSASAEIDPSLESESLKKRVDQLVYSASLVRNPVYRLNTPKEVTSSCEAQVSVKETAKDYIQLMAEIPETESEYINSCEIFVSRKEEHFENSEGIDLTETMPVSMMEAVINAKNEEHEIELYRMYECGTCPKDVIRDDILKTMRYGQDRLNTKPTPHLKNIPVIFSGHDAVRICGFFLDRTNTAFLYRRWSSWETDRPYADDLNGDRVTLKALRHLENSPANRAFDSEGAPVRDLVIIDDGVVKASHGSRMFSYLLHNEDSFIVTNFEVSGGTKSAEEIREGVCLEAVEFSDFQVDPLTGDFYGEIRLAYYHDGNSVSICSGGSVSGNMNEAIHTMRMSTEMTTVGSARIPALIRLENVTVSGSEE